MTPDVERIRAKLGRPPGYEPLYGLDAAALAPILDPHRPSPLGCRRYLAGRSDMGIVRLERLRRAGAAHRPFMRPMSIYDKKCAKGVATVHGREYTLGVSSERHDGAGQTGAATPKEQGI